MNGGYNNYNYEGGAGDYTGGYGDSNYNTNSNFAANSNHGDNGPNPGSPTKSRPNMNVVPITISMISSQIKEESGVFQLFGSDVSNAAICGWVKESKDGVNGSKDILVCDGTGSIRCRCYAMDHLDDLHGYVYVIGALKPYNNVVTITVHYIVHVPSLNFVIDHYLGAIESYIYHQKKSNGFGNTKSADTMYTDPSSGVQMTTLENKIHTLLYSNKQNGGEGISVDEIVMMMGKEGKSRDEVLFTINEMVNAMTIYETSTNVYTSS